MKPCAYRFNPERPPNATANVRPEHPPLLIRDGGSAVYHEWSRVYPL
jgi:hypothetical protein